MIEVDEEERREEKKRKNRCNKRIISTIADHTLSEI